MIDASAFQLLLMAVTGWLARQEREVIVYLIEEKRCLRRQLGSRRVRLTDDDRRRLAARAYRVGCRCAYQELHPLISDAFRGASAPLDDVPAATAAAHHRNCRRDDHLAGGDGRRLQAWWALEGAYETPATTGAALAGELDDLRRGTFVSMMEAADLRNGGDAPDWGADRPSVR